MEININNIQAIYDLVNTDKEMIEKIVAQIICDEKFNTNIEVSITIADNEYIQNLNKVYRNIDKPTDVLSFSMLEDDENMAEMLLPKFAEEKILLGDIIISIEKVIEQANEYNHSLNRELGFLTCHGMYHLLGYDHQDEDSEKEMFSKQELILKKLDLNR